MTTINMHMEFEIEIRKQTPKLHSGIHVNYMYRVQKPKNLIWLPGGHFENDFAENQ